MEWINKQGDFYVESPINFVTAIIWFLRKYENGKYRTLPHIIELMQAGYDELFPVLNTDPEIAVLVNPFVTAYQNGAMEQLEGQLASAKIGMAKLSSPQLYWVLSGNDFTLNINNPEKPKIVCVDNNPEKQQIYRAVLSLYISRLIRQVNRKDMMKSSLVFDEFPTIYFNNMDSLIATARSNKVAITLAMQDRQSVSVNRTDTTVSHSKLLDSAVHVSKIASLSSGKFVGMVADNPDEKIKLKMFHSEIIKTGDKLNEEAKKFSEIPHIKLVSAQEVQDNYYQVKLEVKQLIEKEVSRLKQKAGI
jgi:hypothetical protein